jgi:hypothetical protein
VRDVEAGGNGPVLERGRRCTGHCCFSPHFVVTDCHHDLFHSETGSFLARIGEHEWTQFSLEFVVEHIVADILPTPEGIKFAHKLHVCGFLMGKLRACNYNFL